MLDLADRDVPKGAQNLAMLDQANYRQTPTNQAPQCQPLKQVDPEPTRLSCVPNTPVR